jgi:hypothetical protein
MRIDPRKVEALLLSSANEDYIGLYEAVWELNAAYKDALLGEKYSAAERAIRSLIAKGWVQLHRVRLAERMYPDKYQTVETSEIDKILLNPASWYPDYDGVRIVFTATQEGEKAYLSKRDK